MLKSIFNAFVSNKAGKLYLSSILVLIISNIIISTDQNLYLVGTIAVILYVIALINYSRHMEIKIWITILLVALTLVPFGIWMTLFYFARKNYYIYHSED
jgi:energy-coupling factor transporter transmembrane protein EcfT